MKDNVKERPILFSTSMVQAILEGRKTQTRRIVSDCTVINDPRSIVSLTDGNRFAHFRFKGEQADFAGDVFPYGKIGDRIWVRETFQDAQCFDFNKTGFVYKADKGCVEFAKSYNIRWKPSIHMPRAASRILLEVEEIQVERLQDITEQDAISEGVEKLCFGTIFYKHYDTKKFKSANGGTPLVRNARSSFMTLWSSLYSEESLQMNPWVWVVKFKVLEVSK